MNCCCCPGTGSHGKEDLCFQVDGGELKRRKTALMSTEGLHGCAPVRSPLTYHVIQLCLQGMIGTWEDGDSRKAGHSKCVVTPAIGSSRALQACVHPCCQWPDGALTRADLGQLLGEAHSQDQGRSDCRLLCLLQAPSTCWPLWNLSD